MALPIAGLVGGFILNKLFNREEPKPEPKVPQLPDIFVLGNRGSEMDQLTNFQRDSSFCATCYGPSQGNNTSDILDLLGSDLAKLLVKTGNVDALLDLVNLVAGNTGQSGSSGPGEIMPRPYVTNNDGQMDREDPTTRIENFTEDFKHNIIDGFIAKATQLADMFSLGGNASYNRF